MSGLSLVVLALIVVVVEQQQQVAVAVSIIVVAVLPSHKHRPGGLNLDIFPPLVQVLMLSRYPAGYAGSISP